MTIPCGPYPINLAEDKFAEDYCFGIDAVGFCKQALEFSMSAACVSERLES